MAWWHRQYVSEQTTQQRAEYEQAEFNAKIRLLRLCNSKNPLPPWDWRRGRLEEWPPQKAKFARSYRFDMCGH